MFIKILPLALLFLLGYIYRKIHVLAVEDGRSLSKLVIYVTMPCLAFTSFSQEQYTTNEVFILALLGLGIPVILFRMSLLVSKHLDLERRRLAVFLSSATVANLSFFLYPFFEAYYGKEGLVKLIMFDIGNTIAAYTIAYFIALKYGTDQKHSLLYDVRNLLKFPPVWGIAFGIIYALVSSKSMFTLPDHLLDFISRVGQSNSLIAMVVLGIFFNLSIRNPRDIMWAVFIRMACGMAMGALLAWILDLEGLVRMVAILAPGMPVGLSIVVYSVQLDLDSEYAVSILSISLMIGLAVIFLFMQ